MTHKQCVAADKATSIPAFSDSVLLHSCLNYLSAGLQVAESATQFFIAGDKPTVSGLVLAGSADFKTELSQSDMFDQRLQAIILAVVDVSYGVFQHENMYVVLVVDSFACVGPLPISCLASGMRSNGVDPRLPIAALRTAASKVVSRCSNIIGAATSHHFNQTSHRHR